jgi:hypothetical protein
MGRGSYSIGAVDAAGFCQKDPSVVLAPLVEPTPMSSPSDSEEIKSDGEIRAVSVGLFWRRDLLSNRGERLCRCDRAVDR